MIIKEEVVLAGLNIVMRPVLIEADYLWKRHGQELVVTSGLEGQHSAGSLHYYGYALDFRTRYFDEQEKKTVLDELKATLGSSFQCILHKTHIHVEWVGLG
jgi:hypothetical protein